MRAMEIGDTSVMMAIGVKKTELRNITEQDLSSVTDFESLKLLWPTSILGNCTF